MLDTTGAGELVGTVLADSGSWRAWWRGVKFLFLHLLSLKGIYRLTSIANCLRENIQETAAECQLYAGTEVGEYYIECQDLDNPLGGLVVKCDYLRRTAEDFPTVTISRWPGVCRNAYTYANQNYGDPEATMLIDTIVFLVAPMMFESFRQSIVDNHELNIGQAAPNQD